MAQSTGQNGSNTTDTKKAPLVINRDAEEVYTVTTSNASPSSVVRSR